MPTGFTDFLLKGTPPDEWLRRVMPRSMCALIMLRDEPFELTPAQIEERLASTSGQDYYLREITEYETDLQTMRGWGEDEWRAALVRKTAEAVDANAKAKSEAAEVEAKYGAARALAERMLERAAGTDYAAMFEYALSQLKDCAGDAEPHVRVLPTSWEAFRDREVAGAERGLTSARRLLDSERQNSAERLAWWKGLQAFLDANLQEAAP